jgi:hypothetical protein
MEPYTVRGVSRIEKQQEIIKEQQIKKPIEQDQLATICKNRTRNKGARRC